MKYRITRVQDEGGRAVATVEWYRETERVVVDREVFLVDAINVPAGGSEADLAAAIEARARELAATVFAPSPAAPAVLELQTVVGREGEVPL